MPQPLVELGGQGDLLHIAIANGFPPATYLPVFRPLMNQFRVVSLPPRALWSPPPSPQSTRTWLDVAEDLLTGLRAHDLSNVIAVGHSIGAIVSLVAAAREPARFRGLVLLDPTIFPRPMLWLIRVMQTVGQQARMPLVKGALKRRADFASYDEAFAYWREKKLFRNWTDEGVRLYTESVLQPVANGDGLELIWSPQWEAKYYQTILTTTWRYLPHLRQMPLLVIRGGTSDTLRAETAQQMRRQLPLMAYHEIEGHGHLFPHSAPEETTRILQAWLARIKS
jgi:pimeloyl-ACP methyl ester carboxylesterase